MSNYIKITDEFITTFLSPIANVMDRAPFHIDDGKITVNLMNSNGDVAFGLCFTMDIDTDITDTTINISDLTKFKNLLTKATELDSNDKLELDNNVLKYKSDKWRWKYYLFDGSLLQKTRKLKQEQLDNFNASVSFVIKPEVLMDIVKIKALHKNNSDKVYFKFTDDSISACITDYTSANTDELGVTVSDKFESDGELDQAILKFDLIKILSQHRGVPFKVKISKQAIVFQTIWDGVKISYMSAQLTK
jgi:hypothetical protein